MNTPHQNGQHKSHDESLKSIMGRIERTYILNAVDEQKEPKKPPLSQPRPASKYELNLAEFPLTLLSKRPPKGLSVIEYHDTIRGRNGKLVPRKWLVSPSVQFGFGTPDLIGLLFEIFQMWKEQGFESKEITFGSLYNLARRMGLSTTDPDVYRRLMLNLHALTGMFIRAENAFWDKEKDAYVTIAFHLFESVDIYHREASSFSQHTLPFSRLVASDAIWKSISSNAILTLKNLDRQLFHSYSPAEQRIVLYLGKRMRSNTTHWRDVENFLQQIPINAKSYIIGKKTLTQLCDSLLHKGCPYFTAYRYDKRHDNKRRHIITFSRPTSPSKPGSPDPTSDEQRSHQDALVQEILSVTTDEHSRGFYTLVARRMRPERIYAALSVVKDTDRTGKTLTTPARHFTHLIKEYAKQDGIAL